jgi:hypothetical protein
LLIGKFQRNLERRYKKQQSDRIFSLALDHQGLIETPVAEFMDLLAIPEMKRPPGAARSGP